MKTRIALFLLFAFAVSLSAQDAKVSKKAKEAFAKLHPSATEVKWSKEGEKEFEVSFKDGEIEGSLVLNKKGDVLETETIIAKSELPSEALKFVKENHPDHKITEAAKIVDSKGNVTFEIEITKSNKKTDLIFDKDGKPVVKKAMKEKDEKDEEDKD